MLGTAHVTKLANPGLSEAGLALDIAGADTGADTGAGGSVPRGQLTFQPGWSAVRVQSGCSPVRAAGAR